MRPGWLPNIGQGYNRKDQPTTSRLIGIYSVELASSIKSCTDTSKASASRARVVVEISAKGSRKIRLILLYEISESRWSLVIDTPLRSATSFTSKRTLLIISAYTRHILDKRVLVMVTFKVCYLNMTL
jgi:hypothetical protein